MMFAAYVCGEPPEGLILESPYKLGDSLNGVPGLDIEAEKELVEHKLHELQRQGATDKEIKVAMKDLGLKRFVKINFRIIFYFLLLSFLFISEIQDNKLKVFNLNINSDRLITYMFFIFYW